MCMSYFLVPAGGGVRLFRVMYFWRVMREEQMVTNTISQMLMVPLSYIGDALHRDNMGKILIAS